MSNGPASRILYCHCAYANVVPPEVKGEVLRRLAESGAAFDAVADLCELSAKRDPALKELVAGIGTAGGADGDGPTLKIAACYPRAVRWLFNGGEAPLPAEPLVQIRNMRVESADAVVRGLLGEEPAAGNAAAEEVVPEAAGELAVAAVAAGVEEKS